MNSIQEIQKSIVALEFNKELTIKPRNNNTEEKRPQHDQCGRKRTGTIETRAHVAGLNEYQYLGFPNKW